MFYEIFTKLCKNNSKSPTAVLQELRISTSKLTAWKHGSAPSVAVLLLLSEYFGVSIDYLLTEKLYYSVSAELSTDEQHLLEVYRQLSDQGQDYIQQQLSIAKEFYKK